jgi:3-dehydroquinate dehydratase II
MRVLILHGPNLNLLGSREPSVYGTQTLEQVDESIRASARDLDIDVHIEQHNGEGAIVDALHAARATYDAAIVNPGAYSHYSYAIADAITSIDIPVVEVHLTNIAARENFRRISVTAAACRGSVSGFGAAGYTLALRALMQIDQLKGLPE